jgi:hypothetical protein
MQASVSRNGEPGGAPLFLLVLLAAFGLVLAWSATVRIVGVDFYQFWVVGQTLSRPGINIYSDEDRTRLGAEFLEKARQTGDPRRIVVAEYRKKLETYSSPFLYTLFRLGSTGDFEADLRNYRRLLLVCLTLGVVVLARLLHHSWETTLGALAIFSAWFGPFASDLKVANVNSLQLAALAVYLWTTSRLRWRRRDLIGGALLGLLVAFKLNLVFVPGLQALHWTLTGQIRRLLLVTIGAVLGGTLAIGMAAASFGTLHCWLDWLAALRSLPEDIIPVQYGNYAPARLLNESLGLNVTAPLALVLGGLPAIVLWSRRRTAPDADGEALVLCTGCLLVVSITRLAWLHYYVLAIPALLVGLQPRPNSPARQRDRVGSVLVALALVAYSFDSLANLGFAPTTHLRGILVVLATLVLLGLILTRLGSRAPHRPPLGPEGQ